MPSLPPPRKNTVSAMRAEAPGEPTLAGSIAEEASAPSKKEKKKGGCALM
jgi:hypothetical protein